MYVLEFQTTVQQILSAVPEGKRDELLDNVSDEVIRILVLPGVQTLEDITYRPANLNHARHITNGNELNSTAVYSRIPPKNLTQDATEKGYNSLVQYLLDHPIRVPNVEYLSREEANERY